MITLLMSLSQKCNLNCAYCKSGTMGFNTEIDWLEAVNVAKIVQAKTNQKLIIALHGGEPTLLYPSIKRIVDYFKGDSNYFIQVMTNLYEPNFEEIESLKSMGVFIGISYDGKYDNQRLNLLDESVDDIIFNNILKYYDIFNERIDVVSVLSSENIKSLYKNYRYLLENAPPINWFFSFDDGRISQSSFLENKENIDIYISELEKIYNDAFSDINIFEKVILDAMPPFKNPKYYHAAPPVGNLTYDPPYLYCPELFKLGHKNGMTTVNKKNNSFEISSLFFEEVANYFDCISEIKGFSAYSSCFNEDVCMCADCPIKDIGLTPVSGLTRKNYFGAKNTESCYFRKKIYDLDEKFMTLNKEKADPKVFEFFDNYKLSFV